MKRLALGGVALIAAITLGSVLLLRGGSTASATGTGPTIAVSAPTLNGSGKVQFTVDATTTAADAYNAFNIHLRWDPAVFSFSSASAVGGIFDPALSTGFCAPANTAQFDSDGGGVVLGCSSLVGPTASSGLLATFQLTPAGSGCSALHLFTLGGADAGDSSSGTFTVNDADTTPQANVTVDGTADVSGAACSPPVPTATATATATDTATATNTPGGPTDTATATNTAQPTNTATAVGTATQTPFGGVRSVTPSATPATPGAPTTAPEQPTTAPGGGGPGGVATQPGGGPGGVGSGPTGNITGPNTGTGDGTMSSSTMTIMWIALAMLIAGSGAGYAWYRREHGKR